MEKIDEVALTATTALNRCRAALKRGVVNPSGPFRLLAILMLASVLMCGCTLIGAYDDVIDKGITDYQQKVEAYMTKLENSPSTPYDAGFYEDAYVRLATMKTRAQASFKKDILVKQMDELKSILADFQKGDNGVARKDGQINITFVTDSQSALEVSVESILKLELALKRGKDSAAAN